MLHVIWSFPPAERMLLVTEDTCSHNRTALLFPLFPITCPALRSQQHLPTITPWTHGPSASPHLVELSHLSCTTFTWFSKQLPHAAGSKGLTQSQIEQYIKVFFLFSFLTDKSTDNNQVSFCYFLSSQSCTSPTHVAWSSCLEAAVGSAPWPTAGHASPVVWLLRETLPRRYLSEFVHPSSSLHPAYLWSSLAFLQPFAHLLNSPCSDLRFS